MIEDTRLRDQYRHRVVEIAASMGISIICALRWIRTCIWFLFCAIYCTFIVMVIFYLCWPLGTNLNYMQFTTGILERTLWKEVLDTCYHATVCISKTSIKNTATVTELILNFIVAALIREVHNLKCMHPRGNSWLPHIPPIKLVHTAFGHKIMMLASWGSVCSTYV
jgi:hypothetical protein